MDERLISNAIYLATNEIKPFVEVSTGKESKNSLDNNQEVGELQASGVIDGLG